MSYWRPTSLRDALDIASDGARIAAGCTDLFPATERQRLDDDGERPVLDITAIPEIDGIQRTDEGLRIGAATRWTAILKAPLPHACQALQEAAAEVGSVQIQNAGTIGGNLCNASPAADGAPPLLILDAAVELRSATGARTLPLGAFLTGPRQTALAPGEIMTAVLLPNAALAGRSRFLKLGARKHLVISIVMTAARIASRDGRVVEAAIAVGACSAVAQRIPAAEQALRGASLDGGLSLIPEDADFDRALAPITDIRGDAAYRMAAARVLARRAIRAAAIAEHLGAT
mgnify:FL=1